MYIFLNSYNTKTSPDSVHVHWICIFSPSAYYLYMYIDSFLLSLNAFLWRIRLINFRSLSKDVYKNREHIMEIVFDVNIKKTCQMEPLVDRSGFLVIRAFSPWAGGRGFDARPRHTYDSIKMVQYASLLSAQHIRICLDSLLSQMSLKREIPS